MKYVIYLRVSTKELQDIDVQLQLCLQFIERKHGSKDFGYSVHIDKKSSTVDIAKRPGIQSAMADIKQGDVLVALRVDRIARNAYEATSVRKWLEEKDAGLLMVDQPGCNNRLLFTIYAGMAEEEGGLIRSRIRDKMKVKRMRGEKCARNVPYGYRLDMENLITVVRNNKAVQIPGKLIPDPGEQAILKVMCDLWDDGMSLRQIAHALEISGYKTRCNGKWQIAFLSSVLKRTGRSRPVGLPVDRSTAGCHLVSQ